MSSRSRAVTAPPVFFRALSVIGRAALLSVLICCAGCTRVSSTPAAETVILKIVSPTSESTLSVEVADSEVKRERGLMGRTALQPDSGMFFVFEGDQGRNSGFWMYQTRIPLDVAFIDNAGRITAIMSMEPCLTDQSSRCPVYSPGTPFRSALETKKGYFSEKGITPGAQVFILDSPPKNK